jgi:hypothetical protein
MSVWNGHDSDGDEERLNPYREHAEQYLYADRDFRVHDRVVFIGPPDEEYQPGMMPPPAQHKLYGKHGAIVVGISESIHCYPDDPDDNKYWVRFDDDEKGPRQVSASWLVKEAEFRP